VPCVLRVINGIKAIKKKRIFVQDIKSRTDQYGFLDISDNLPESKRIVIVAPVNCPKAKIADYLATELNKQNIPTTRTNSYNFRQDLNNMSEREINQMIKRAEYVRKMAPPLVIVNGKIKSNPSIEAIKNEWELE